MNQKRNLTIDDIARDLGVSKTTISRAISGKGRISDATRERVMEYIEQRNYRPSAAAKGLAESKTYNLALVLPKSFIQIDLPYIRQAMNAICEEAFIWDYNILICLSTDLYPESLLRTLDNRKVDGVILSRTVENDELVHILNERSIPFATIGSLPEDQKGLAEVEVDHDHFGGCYAFMRPILQSDQSKIALLGNDLRYMVNKSRLSGFRKAMDETAFPESLFYPRMGNVNQRVTQAHVNELLEQGVTRFVAMDDDICLYILNALEKAGRKVPVDTKVYSLYDSNKLEYYPAPVPALRFDATEIGQIACRELLRCLRGEVFDPHPILGYRIINR